jgi:hypothetical protein
LTSFYIRSWSSSSSTSYHIKLSMCFFCVCQQLQCIFGSLCFSKCFLCMYCRKGQHVHAHWGDVSECGPSSADSHDGLSSPSDYVVTVFPFFPAPFLSLFLCLVMMQISSVHLIIFVIRYWMIYYTTKKQPSVCEPFQKEYDFECQPYHSINFSYA